MEGAPSPRRAFEDLRRLRDEAKSRRRDGEFSTLALARLAIAREFGFTSWPRLKTQIDSLTLDVDERAAILVRSACSSDVRRARAMLAADPALSRHDLACACVTGEADEVRRHIERSPELARTATGPFGHEPILYACFSRFLRAEPARAAGIREVVRLLLDAGADPNASFDHDGWLQVPVYGAAGIANDVETTRILIEAGADPNDAGGDRTVGEALYHACEFPDPTCAALLIDAGTDRQVVDYCLGRALNFPDSAVAEMFCARGARPSAGQLSQAVFRRRPLSTIRALIDAGAPVDEPDGNGQTPLIFATRWGLGEVAAVLLEQGADPTDVRDEDRALGKFLSSSTGRSAGTAEPSAVTSELGSPAEGTALRGAAGLDEMLTIAVQAGDLGVVRSLLDLGAGLEGDPEADDQEIPLSQAAWRGHGAIVRELVARGARLTWRDGSPIGAALHGSRHCHHPEAGPSMQTVEEIPQERYAEVVQILLDAGARVPESWDSSPKPVTLIAELGLEPPS